MIGLQEYLPSKRDSWIWNLAEFKDVADCVDLAQRHFQIEIDQIFVPQPDLYAKNISQAICNQQYRLNTEQILVARHRDSHALMAYSWVSRGDSVKYALEEMGVVNFAHVDLTLTARTRITLLAQMLHQWYLWCSICRIPVLVSSSIRSDQTAFMRLHERAGFSVRGSVAYIKIKDDK